MDWLQFLSSVIAAAAWPVAAVVIVHQLRAPIGKLLPLIRSLKYKELQIDLEHKIEAISIDVAAAETSLSAPVPFELDTFEALAEANPRGAISFCWIPLQNEIFKTAARVGINSWNTHDPLVLVDLLCGEGAITKDTAEAIIELGRINERATGTSESVSAISALKMRRLCSWGINTLQRVEASNDAT